MEIEALLRSCVPKSRVAKKYKIPDAGFYNWMVKNPIGKEKVA